MQDVSSWGRLGSVPHEVRRPTFLDEARNAVQSPGRTRLCFGLGRSYGDVCLNANGELIVTDTLDRIISFDRARGILRAEAGLSLERLLRVAVPAGWFSPVVPGTKFVTLGGAVANDVHGKNHEAVGTFGVHIIALGLARSDGQTLTLSRTENAELFAATIGGLGLTGVILWVELQLAPIRSALIDSETLRLKDLADFFRAGEESGDWPYRVAWIDCLAKGSAAGRGFYIRGRHAESGGLAVHRAPRLAAPLDAPGWLLNTHTIGLFNSAYLHRPFVLGAKRVHYEPFLFPLDAVTNWNRLYGKRGFFQHQSAIPMAGAFDALLRLLELTAEFGEGSFLVVLKLFGANPSPGLISFPLPGATLALDFPNKGESTRRLLDRMAEVVLAAEGRLYPAKDATMSGEAFRAGYPAWPKLEALRDPAIMSDFWRRVTMDTA
jgi:FAD/FMN-containing dehydrogenase